MGSRRHAREMALQVLYQADLNKMTAAQALASFFETLSSDKEGEAFARKLVEGCMADAARIDTVISETSSNWRLERMALVDRNVLRLATHELLSHQDIPTRVTLNEAIELAKKFGAEGSAAFVNGVLDKVASQLRRSD